MSAPQRPRWSPKWVKAALRQTAEPAGQVGERRRAALHRWAASGVERAERDGAGRPPGEGGRARRPRVWGAGRAARRGRQRASLGRVEREVVADVLGERQGDDPVGTERLRQGG